jgi:hypothetical protein
MSFDTKSSAVETPPDPDPTPMNSGGVALNSSAAKRNLRKRTASNYGREKTILAGNTPQDNDTKKTILGG